MTLRLCAATALATSLTFGCSGASDAPLEGALDAAYAPAPLPGRDAGAGAGGSPVEGDAAPSVDPVFSGLTINEIAAAGDPTDWFELYNGTADPVDLSTCTFVAGVGSGRAPVNFPAGARIAPHGYYDQSLDDTFPGFKLGKDEDLAVFDPIGGLIDAVDWNDGDAPAGGAFARIPDGTGAFETVSPATPGTRNRAAPTDAGPSDDAGNTSADAGPPPIPAHLVLNEILTHSDATDDFIEIANLGPEAVDLAGWSVWDGVATHRFEFPTETRIAAGGHRVFYRNEPESFTFGLGADDAVLLSDPTGGFVDVFDWADGDIGPGQSYGRLPDGTGTPQALDTPTPGAPNVEGARPRVVINEVSPAVNGEKDWVELYNAGGAEADLAALSLSDSDPTHVVALTHAGLLAPGDFVVLTEGDTFDFGLGEADAVSLVAGDGAILDTTTWTADDVNHGASFGRRPDGTGAFESLDNPSPGESNN